MAQVSAPFITDSSYSDSNYNNYRFLHIAKHKLVTGVDDFRQFKIQRSAIPLYNLYMRILKPKVAQHLTECQGQIHFWSSFPSLTLFTFQPLP